MGRFVIIRQPPGQLQVKRGGGALWVALGAGQ